MSTRACSLVVSLVSLSLSLRAWATVVLPRGAACACGCVRACVRACVMSALLSAGGGAYAGLRTWLAGAECGLVGAAGVLAADDALARFVAEDVTTVADVVRLDVDDLEDLGFTPDVRDLLATAIQALRDAPSSAASAAASTAAAAGAAGGGESKTPTKPPPTPGDTPSKTQAKKKATKKKKQARGKPRYVEAPPSAAAQAAFAALERTLQADKAAGRPMPFPDLNGSSTCKRCDSGEAKAGAKAKTRRRAAKGRPSKLQSFMNRLEKLVTQQEEADKDTADMTEEEFREQMKRDAAEVTSRIGELGLG